MTPTGQVEVLRWGLWGPVIFMVLYAVGPSFLSPRGNDDAALAFAPRGDRFIRLSVETPAR